MSNVDSINEAKLVNGLLVHLKNRNLYRKEDKSKFCSLLWGICGESLLNDDFISWLAKKLDTRKDRLKDHVEGWLKITIEPLENRGRKGLKRNLNSKYLMRGWVNR